MSNDIEFILKKDKKKFFKANVIEKNLCPELCQKCVILLFQCATSERKICLKTYTFLTQLSQPTVTAISLFT